MNVEHWRNMCLCLYIIKIVIICYFIINWLSTFENRHWCMPWLLSSHTVHWRTCEGFFFTYVAYNVISTKTNAAWVVLYANFKLVCYMCIFGEEKISFSLLTLYYLYLYLCGVLNSDFCYGMCTVCCEKLLYVIIVCICNMWI